MNGDAPVPRLPLLKPWYRLLETQDGLLVEHGRSTVCFGGAAATRLLPALLPLLDGSRTVDEVVAALGRPVEAAVENALGLLARHGLLTEGPPQGAAAPTRLDRAAHFLAQAAPLPPARIRDELAAARVLLEGDSELAAAFGRLLRRSGVACVTSARSATLVATATARAGDPLLERRNAQVLEQGTPWLPFGCFDGAAATVGPLVVPGETACHRCLVLRRDACSGCPQELVSLRAVPVRARIAPVFVAAIAAIAAERALRWLGLSDPRLPGSVATITVNPRLALADEVVLRAPRCPACSGAAGSGAPLPWHEARWATA